MYTIALSRVLQRNTGPFRADVPRAVGRASRKPRYYSKTVSILNQASSEGKRWCLECVSSSDGQPRIWSDLDITIFDSKLKNRIKNASMTRIYDPPSLTSFSSLPNSENWAIPSTSPHSVLSSASALPRRGCWLRLGVVMTMSSGASGILKQSKLVNLWLIHRHR